MIHKLAGFDGQEKINIENPTGGRSGGWDGGGGRVRQLRSHVNTNTKLREEKRTAQCSRKSFFHIMNKKNEGIRIIFSQKKESQSESETSGAAHGMICNITVILLLCLFASWSRTQTQKCVKC